MSSVISDLGRLVRSQEKQIHDVVHQLDTCDPDSSQYDYLEGKLEQYVLVRDLLLDLIETISAQDA
jgi:hypothetical protein